MHQLVHGLAAVAVAAFCEHDIALLGRHRRAMVEEAQLWVDGTVPYAYAQDVQSGFRRKIEGAMRTIEEVADVSFVQMGRGRKEHLVISTRHAENPGGCWATVGRHAPAKMNLGWCRDTRHIVHELLHVLGMWHEQSRKDSAAYLNLPRTDVNNCIMGGTDSRGMPYDFRSIMHYPIKSLGASVTRRGSERLGEQKTQAARVGFYDEMSDWDIRNLQAMYGRGTGQRRKDAENTSVAAGLIGGGVAIAVLGMFVALR